MIERIVLIAALLGCQGIARGAGIAIMEQSAKELGQAFAGASTNTEDASSVYFNAGAMAQTRSRMLSLAGYAVIPSTRFHDEGSRLGDTPLSGGQGGDAAVTTLLPNLYLLQPLTEKLVAGMGFNVPFGSHNAYPAAWQGRYQALGSSVAAFNFSPALAFRVTDEISVGAGLDIQYLRATFTNAIDFGTLCLQAFGPSLCTGLGLSPQQADGRVAFSGDSTGVGYNLGIHYTPRPGTSLGVSYRSRIEHTLEGKADFNVPAAATPLTTNGFFTDTDAQTRTTLPDSVSFGFSQTLGADWTISGNALWTHWSLVQELRTRFASAQPDAVQHFDWQDTWRYALGLSYRPESVWTVRAGIAYDQTPIPNARRRSVRIPDSDRIWLTAGFSYRFFKDFTVHGAYAHLFFADASINSVGESGDRLIGHYEQQTDIVGLQLDWRF